MLGIGPDKLVLLDTKTKLLLKTHTAADLREWTGSGPEGIILEFRGSKPWLLSIQSPEDLKAVRSALWNIGSSSRPMGTLPFHEDVLEFGTRIHFAAFVAHTQVISYLFRIY